jgi:diguanylate cyclase (GGDEF)-like protein
MLLAMLAAVTPLIAIAVLQVVAELPQALVGAVVLMSLLLVGGVTLIFRPSALSASAANASANGASKASFSFAPQEDSLGPISRDPLTNLPTFQPFSRRLYEEFQYVKHAGGQLAVVLVDINNLASINEQFGPGVGDEALQHVTTCLQASKRMNDVVARMGDDEFGMLLLDCDAAGAKAFVERVQEWLARESIPVTSKGRTTSLWVGVCAGVAVCGDAMENADDAITMAVDDLNASRDKRDRLRSNWQRSA